MLRLLVGILILLSLIFSFMVFMHFRISGIAGDLFESLDHLEQKVEKEDWSRASEEIKDLGEKWQEADSWWTPLMNHREINAAEQSIIKVGKYIEIQNKEDSLVEIGLAKGLIRRIRDREKPSIKNIF